LEFDHEIAHRQFGVGQTIQNFAPTRFSNGVEGV
jgi:hypothetical protein